MMSNEIEDNEPIMISLEIAEGILAIRDYIEKKEGIKMGFQETLNYMLQEVIDKEGILDKLHKQKIRKKKL